MIGHLQRRRSAPACAASLIRGVRSWCGDYWRLTREGDLIDRVVGGFLIPVFVCLAVWLVGDYLTVVVSQELEQKAHQNEQQSYVQEEFIDDNLTARVAAQDYLIGSNVAGQDEGVYPDNYGSCEVEYKSEFFHVLNSLPYVKCGGAPR